MMITRCLSIKATVVIVLALICLLPIIILSNHSAIRSKINSFRKPNLVHQNGQDVDLDALSSIQPQNDEQKVMPFLSQQRPSESDDDMIRFSSASDDEHQSDNDLDLSGTTLVDQHLTSNTQTVPSNEPPMENDHMPPAPPNSQMSWMSSFSESGDEFGPSEPFGSEEENKWFPLHFLDNQQNLMCSIDSGSVPPVQSIESDDLKTSLLDEESLLEMFSLISEKEWDSDDDQSCDPAVYLKALRMHQFNLAIAPKTPIIFHGDQIEVVKQCPLNKSVFEVQSAESANDTFAERTAPGKLNATCE
eukprot:128069_1